MAICVVSNFLWWWAKYHNECNLDIIGNSWWFFFFFTVIRRDSRMQIPELKNIWNYSERGCATPHDLYVPSHTTCKSPDYFRGIKGNSFPSQAALLWHKISLNQVELAPQVHSDSVGSVTSNSISTSNNGSCRHENNFKKRTQARMFAHPWQAADNSSKTLLRQIWRTENLWQ